MTTLQSSIWLACAVTHSLQEVKVTLTVFSWPVAGPTRVIVWMTLGQLPKKYHALLTLDADWSCRCVGGFKSSMSVCRLVQKLITSLCISSSVNEWCIRSHGVTWSCWWAKQTKLPVSQWDKCQSLNTSGPEQLGNGKWLSDWFDMCYTLNKPLNNYGTDLFALYVLLCPKWRWACVKCTVRV